MGQRNGLTRGDRRRNSRLEALRAVGTGRPQATTNPFDDLRRDAGQAAAPAHTGGTHTETSRRGKPGRPAQCARSASPYRSTQPGHQPLQTPCCHLPAKPQTISPIGTTRLTSATCAGLKVALNDSASALSAL